METEMCNLLSDPLLSVVDSDGRSHRLSLPAAYEMIVRGRLAQWPGLRPHQGPAWHMMLVQIGVLAHRASGSDTLVSESDWRQALRALTPDFPADEPWSLVVDDWQRPAFLQPACESIAARADYKTLTRFADSLDMLITSKNHDVKGDRMTISSEEDWLYALVALQTTEGFLGAGNYGIARMNGGFASRPMLRCHPGRQGAGGQITRDIRALLDGYDEWLDRLAEDSAIGTGSGVQPLLWLLPWDGKTTLALERFHPLAIEVCRRVRLERSATGLQARSAGSKVARVAAKEAKGNVGDPWAPIEKKDGKAFTVTVEGYSYRRMVDLLDPGRYQQPKLARPTQGERDGSDELFIHAAGIARGQGKTEGVHRRTVSLSRRTSRLFAKGGEEFGRRARMFVDRAGEVSRSALRPALIQMVQGKESPDWKKPSNDMLSRPWLSRYDSEVDRRFFLVLDASFEAEEDDETAERRWSLILADVARQVFLQASETLPCNGELRLLAKARASIVLNGGLRKQLPALRESIQEVMDES